MSATKHFICGDSSNRPHCVYDDTEQFSPVLGARLVDHRLVARWWHDRRFGDPPPIRRRTLDQKVARNQPVARAGYQHQVADDISVENAVQNLVCSTNIASRFERFEKEANESFGTWQHSG